MKKILVVILAFVMAGFMAVAPAQAEQKPVKATKANTVTVKTVMERKATCLVKIGSVSVTMTVDNSTGDLRVAPPGKGAKPNPLKRAVSVDMAIRVWYNDCPTYSRVTDIVYQVGPRAYGCGDRIQNFQINPNVIGTWNPGNVTFNCSGTGAYSLARANPNPTVIRATAPANERCVGFTGKIALAGSTDKSGTSNSYCVI